VSKNRRNKKTTRKTKAKRTRRVRESPSRSPEVVGIIGLGAALFTVLGLLSLQAGDGGLVGPFGRVIAGLSYGALGMTAYLAIATLVVISLRLLLDRQPLVSAHVLAGVGLGILAVAILLHLIAGDYLVAGRGPGGALGESVAEILRAVVSTAGTALLAVVGLLLSIVIATPVRLSDWIPVLARKGKAVGAVAAQRAVDAGTGAARFAGEVVRAVLPERDGEEYDYDDEYYDDDDVEEPLLADPAFVDPPIIDARSGPVAAATAEPEVEPEEIIELTEPKKPANKKRAKKKAEIVEDEVIDAASSDDQPAGEPGGDAPQIVESEFRGKKASELDAASEKVDAERLEFIPLGDGDYKLPPVNLLRYDEGEANQLDRTAMLELSAKLAQTLENYGVKGKVTAIRPGPVVTMYEFAPAPGTRISKITRLADDLAMALEALKVRIVAPIPGKAAVGIEVPNRSRETVYLKEIIADDKFQRGKWRLPLALGKNIEGAPSVVDLAKMPHLLVAGTTGSGKSVSVNSMITSLLYNSTPADVRLIMVDPKMLELSIYEGIPHLLLPVVTDPKKANLALRWAVDEMERRYDLLARMGVRDIASYNKKLEKERARFNAARLQAEADQAARIAEGEADDGDQLELDFEEPPKHLPYIVVIIDEFADLIMCAPKEVETSVARIAQKARAAGIHLILATQRPSVNVITGIIKANFPSRIAFRVTSKVDARTILDQGGAEALLGAGDMLFSDRGAAPKRLHGCFVDEEEIHEIVEFLKTQGKPIYNLDILAPREGDGDEPGEADEPVDEMYDRAVAIVAETRKVSISYLQRRLSVGYNRAAKMVEHMEREGVVSAPDNKKVREVLITGIDAA
jgi:S-DNA-T family DNA segregation ATPase FtsK/SpoIIIE